MRSRLILCRVAWPGRVAAVPAGTGDCRTPDPVYRQTGHSPIKSETAVAEFACACNRCKVTMKTSTKAKARANVRAFGKSNGVRIPRGTIGTAGLLVLFWLLFRGGKALEALEKFLLGHAFDRDLGIIGIDAGAR